ncbi:MAG: hypothetical protein IKS33_03790 [Bacteroidales bacterium]|nr:hypothetical protein [Bacteroidales bacterium]
MRLLQRYVNDNFNKAITFEDYVVFTCFEKFLCENCYRIPMDSIYRQVCNKYFSHAIYVVIDTPKTKTRLQQYAYPNIYFLYDKHHQMTKYGILQVVPQVMVFENKKIKYTELYNRK